MFVSEDPAVKNLTIISLGTGDQDNKILSIFTCWSCVVQNDRYEKLVINYIT